MMPSNRRAAYKPLPISIATRSPGSMPRSSKRCARRRDACCSPENVSSRPVSGAISQAESGRAAAWRSIQSRTVRSMCPRSAPEPAEVIAEDLFLGRNLLGNRARDTRDVEVVPVVEIVREAVAAPGPATHRQRKRQPIVEVAAGREAVRLIDDDARDRQVEPESHYVRVVARVDADRMAGALVRVDCAHDLAGVLEVVRAIDSEHG